MAMMPSGLGFGNLGNQGSPTRMEMGQGGGVEHMNTAPAVEVPVPSTPPGMDDARGTTFGMQTSGSNAVGASNLGGKAGNLGFVGNLRTAASELKCA